MLITKLRFLLLLGGVLVVVTALGRLVAADGESSDFRIGSDFGVSESGVTDFGGVVESCSTDGGVLVEVSTSM